MTIQVAHVAKLRTDIPNGPLFSVPSLVENLNRFTNQCRHRLIDLNYEQNKPFYNGGTKFKHLTFVNDVSMSLTDTVLDGVQLLIFHEFYHFEFLKLARQAGQRGIPYIIVPRGSLARNAKRHKWLKKKVADIVLFNRFLRRAHSVQFLSHGEYLESKGNLLNRLNFIVPNGISQKNLYTKVKAKKIIYLGRLCIHTKGLDTLMLSLSKLQKKLSNQSLQIELYGEFNPPTDKAKLEKILRDLELVDVIKIMPAVYDDAKAKAFADGDVFITLSRFEGQPVALLEALSYGLPVVITEETNLAKEVIEYNAGIVVSHSPEQIANALYHLTQMNIEDMSRGATKLIEQLYSWKSVAIQTENYYLKPFKL